MCDKDVCLRKDYLDCLKAPKRLYYEFSQDVNSFNLNEIEMQIKQSLEQADKLKTKYTIQKMNISWGKFQSIIEEFLEKCLQNYKPLNENEDVSKIVMGTDLWTEDNYVVKYLSQSLQGYLKDYEKMEYSRIYKKSRRDKRIYNRCSKCGRIFIAKTFRQQYCPTCTTYQPLLTKTITCIDCGKEVVVDSKDNKAERCGNCQKIKDRENGAKRYREWYQRNKT